MASNSAGIGGLLPPQTTDVANYILTTDGQTASWEASSASLPSQGGNSGKYLTTNGTTASWAAVSALPDQTGNNGKFLTTDGSAASWATVSGVTTGDQSWDGVKTFTSVPVAAGVTTPTTSSFTLTSKATDGATAKGTILNNLTALTTQGAAIASFQTNSVEKAIVGLDGTYCGGVGTPNPFIFGMDLSGVSSCGLWMGVNQGSQNLANYSLLPGGIFNSGTSVTAMSFRIANVPVVGMALTILDLSPVAGYGIKFASPDGLTTKTLTIDNTGAPVWA